jgi:hypothetical protein
MTGPQPAPSHSKRVEKFRKGLVKEIPRFPNDKASLQALDQKHLTDLFITYFNWRIRLVAPRPRTVTIAPALTSDARWPQWSTEIADLLDKARRGDDLTGHLSLEPQTRGYTPASSAPGATPVDRWSDKDMLLNVMGYHHFHIGPAARQHRSDELVFARVTRSDFEALAMFDHDVFTSGSTERTRLHVFHEREMTKGLGPGQAVLMSAITTAGTPIQCTNAAIDYIALIRKIDPLLDDPSRVAELRSQFGINASAPEKLTWAFKHLDLCLYDKTGGQLFILRQAPT